MSKSIEDIEFKIGRLELRDGDILVVKVAQPITRETAQRMRDHLERHTGGHQVLVLDGTAELSVLTQADIAARLS